MSPGAPKSNKNAFKHGRYTAVYVGRQIRVSPSWRGAQIMKPAVPKLQRCAIYTRKSTEHNLDLEFNSLDAQREACEAYIKSQTHEGWRLVPDRYDDGGLSGASLDRLALQDLLADVRAGKITVVVVYEGRSPDPFAHRFRQAGRAV
jgi:hypothetical protein